jgi:hypothetical protein
MKYVPGLAVGQLSGSSGNTTASHNRFGAYIRTRTIPVNPDTSFQQQVRANFSTIAAAWRGLTPAQRLDWTTLGAQIQRVDSLGVVYNLTGLQAFQSVNAIRLLAGLAVATDSPVLSTLPELDTFSVTNAGPGPTLSAAFTPTPIGAGQRVELWATRAVSRGRSFFGPREYRRIFLSADDAASPLDIAAAYTARFGPLDLNEKISFKGRVINANFIAGSFKRFDLIITSV